MATTTAKRPVIVSARLMLGEDTLAYWSAGHIARDVVDFAHELRIVVDVEDYGADGADESCRVTCFPKTV